MACCTWIAESSAEAAERTVQDAQALLALDPRPDWLAQALAMDFGDNKRSSWKALKELHATVDKEHPESHRRRAWGVALSLLAFSRLQVYICFSSEDEVPGQQEALDAFFKALASSRSTVVVLKLRGPIFGTPRSAAQLGQYLNTNATLQELQVDVLGKLWWPAFSNSLSGNGTLRTLRFRGLDVRIGGDMAATINRFAVLTDLRLHLGHSDGSAEARELLSPLLTNAASTLTSLTVKDFPSNVFPVISMSQVEGLVLVTAEALLQNSSTKLETLVIKISYENPKHHLRSSTAEKVAQMLRSNSALRSLHYPSRLRFEGSAVVDGMSLNHRLSLEKLSVTLDDAGAAALFRLLTPRPGRAPAQSAAPASLSVNSNASVALSQLRELSVSRCSPDTFTQAALQLAGMLASNATLVELHLQNASYYTKQWVAILPALAFNTTLQTLDLSYCDGVDGEEVYKVLTDLLIANTTIQRIDLEATPLERAGKAEALREAIRRNMDYRASLGAGVPKMRPKSGRLVLCGYPFAGKNHSSPTMFAYNCKSTLLDTMCSIKQQQMGSPHERGETSNPSISKLHIPNAAGERERPRTRGIEVVTLRDDEDLRISAWDFAGQQEYYALHDCVFPDTHGSAIFLFACNPMDAIVSNRMKHFRHQLEYWVRFICSNSRPEHTIKPMVIVVVTHQDLPTTEVNKFHVKRTMEELAEKFSNLVHVETNSIFLLNATDQMEVTELLAIIETKFNELFLVLEEVPTICELTLLALQQWAKKAGGNPIMTMDEFKQLVQATCEVEVERMKVEFDKQHMLQENVDENTSDGTSGNAFQDEQVQNISKEIMALQNFIKHDSSWKGVAAYLRDTGTIIYFEELDFMVIDPHWFGHAIFGYFINPFLCEVEEKPAFKPENGIVKAEELAQLLEDSLLRIKASKHMVNPKISIKMLIQLMKRFNLCYEHINDKNEKQYLIPILMGDANDPSMKGEFKRQWKDAKWKDARRTDAYIGRWLHCADTERTFLTPGFFPRLQMILYTMCVSQGWVAREDLWKTNLLELNMFQISINGPGHEILVEYGAQAGYFVDVFVRSERDYCQVVKFVQDHLITKIREFCASQQGCIGVSLVEDHIRKECVRSLTLCKYRTEDTCISISKLRDEIPKCHGNIYIHHWRAIDGSDPPLGHGSEYAALVQGGILMLDDDQQQVRAAQAGYPRNQAVGDVSTVPLGPVYLTLNVGLWRKFVSRLYLGRVIPLRLHVMCECGDHTHQHECPAHRVACQQGRMFYLMDKDAMTVQPWASWVYPWACLAAKVGLSFAPVPGAGLAGDALSSMPLRRTSYCDRPVEALLEAGEGATSMSSDTLRNRLEVFLARNPQYSWKTKFLEQSNVKKDFGLSKTRLRGEPNSPYIWLCDFCMEQEGGQRFELC